MLFSIGLLKKLIHTTNNESVTIIMKAFLMVYHIFIHSEANDLVISYSMHMK